MMLHKPDFEAAVQRMQAFWAHDCLDRCGLQVIARRGKPVEARDADLWMRRTDIDYILDEQDRQFGAFHYLAEAVPFYTPGLVCSDTAAYLAEDIELREDTVWYHPVIHDWDEYELVFDRGNRWWQLTRAMAEAAAERGRGKYLVAVPDFQPAIDIVSLLRSPEKLCLDLVDHPDRVRKAASFVLNDVYVPCYREIRAIFARHAAVVSDWMGLFSDGNHDVVQCDFCALVGPRHFEEFCLPEIQAQCQMLDTSIFHLDGPDATKHLDCLLEVPELGAVQFVPGAGKPPAVAWLPLLKRVQEAGKSLLIYAEPGDVAPILEALPPRGLMISVAQVFDSQEDAESFIERVERDCRA